MKQWKVPSFDRQDRRSQPETRYPHPVHDCFWQRFPRARLTCRLSYHKPSRVLGIVARLFEGVTQVDGPKDTVWILQRPRSLAEADRAHAAPPVLVFDREGRYLRGFGGPGAGYDWPQIEHTLAVDAKGRAWISGSFRADPAKMDSQILVFDTQGKFLRQIGRPGASLGNADTANFGAPADIFVDDARGETYVADGYVNRRLIVLDSETGAFTRMWSAFGAPPPN